MWLRDARRSGIYGMQRFARALRHDIEAVRNSVQEPWSNGQTEGQINRLQTLKRAMYGRTGIDLLRARLSHYTTKFCTKSEPEPHWGQRDSGRS